MTSLCLWGPVELKIQRPPPRCRTLTWSPTWIGLRGFEELSWSRGCSTRGRFEKFWKIERFHSYLFIINSYHVTLVFGTHKQIYIMSLPWCKTCTLSLCPFLHARRTVSFSLGDFALQNPPSGMHRKWNGRCQGEVQLSSWSLRFSQHMRCTHHVGHAPCRCAMLLH